MMLVLRLRGLAESAVRSIVGLSCGFDHNVE